MLEGEKTGFCVWNCWLEFWATLWGNSEAYGSWFIAGGFREEALIVLSSYVVTHVENLSIWEVERQEDHMFEVSLGLHSKIVS